MEALVERLKALSSPKRGAYNKSCGALRINPTSLREHVHSYQARHPHIVLDRDTTIIPAPRPTFSLPLSVKIRELFPQTTKIQKGTRVYIGNWVIFADTSTHNNQYRTGIAFLEPDATGTKIVENKRRHLTLCKHMRADRHHMLYLCSGMFCAIQSSKRLRIFVNTYSGSMALAKYVAHKIDVVVPDDAQIAKFASPRVKKLVRSAMVSDT